MIFVSELPGRGMRILPPMHAIQNTVFTAISSLFIGAAILLKNTVFEIEHNHGGFQNDYFELVIFCESKTSIIACSSVVNSRMNYTNELVLFQVLSFCGTDNAEK